MRQQMARMRTFKQLLIREKQLRFFFLLPSDTFQLAIPLPFIYVLSSTHTINVMAHPHAGFILRPISNKRAWILVGNILGSRNEGFLLDIRCSVNPALDFLFCLLLILFTIFNKKKFQPINKKSSNVE